jgi:hydroxymethylglutaryl-CoA reductase
MQTQEKLILFFETEFPILLQNIKKESKPIWGAMDAQRMLEHVALAFKIANGKIIIPVSSIDLKADKLKKLFLLSDRPLPKDFQNPILPAGLQPYEHQSFEIAKQKLIDEVKSFHFNFNSNSDLTCVHNLFGNLNYHEWLWFEYKHTFHHFMQFGIVPLSDKII